jgi:hypothetical protein
MITASHREEGYSILELIALIKVMRHAFGDCCLTYSRQSYQGHQSTGIHLLYDLLHVLLSAYEVIYFSYV